MSRLVFSAVLLTIIYAITLGSFAAWDLAIGGLLSLGIMLAFRRALFNGASIGLLGLLKRSVAFFPFAAAILYEVAVGTWTVVLIVLHLRPLVRPGIVAVPIGARSRTGVAVSAMATTLSPGSYLVDVDWRKRLILLHVIDASDPEQVIEAHQHFYERYQRHVFP